MLASELYATTLKALTDARAAMLTPEWIAAQETQDPETRLRASQSLLQTQQAIAALSNAALSTIAVQMEAQESALRSSASSLESSLKHLERVQEVLTRAAELVELVGSVVPLI